MKLCQNQSLRQIKINYKFSLLIKLAQAVSVQITLEIEISKMPKEIKEWSCMVTVFHYYAVICINETQFYFVFADCVHTSRVVPFSLLVILLMLVSGRGVSWWTDKLLANCFEHQALSSPWGHLLGTWIIYLFIQQNKNIILAAQQHIAGKSRLPLCCVWKLIPFFFFPCLLLNLLLHAEQWAAALGHTVTSRKKRAPAFTSSTSCHTNVTTVRIVT